MMLHNNDGDGRDGPERPPRAAPPDGQTADAGDAPEAAASEPAAADGRLDDPQLDHIGVELRKLYDGLMREPVPERLTGLLARLDEPEDENGRSDAGRPPESSRERGE